jgi:stage II sporulation protein E
MNDIYIVGFPFVILAMTAVLPFFMGKRVLAGADGKYIRQSTAARLKGFAGSLERLSESMSVICERVVDNKDSARLERALTKCRAVLCDELSCLSAQLRRIENELINELVPDSEAGRRISERLKACGIRFTDVLAYNHNGRYEVRIIRRLNGDCTPCKARIASEASKALGVKMTIGNGICSRDGDNCILKLYEEHPYHISVYAAAKKRDGSPISGDSHTFMELKYGTYMLALSDGMGSGGKAKEESAASVELFEDFMEAGFERDAALDQINSLLLIRAGDEDIFATMDICNVDLYDGTAEFVKIGGMPGFIATKDGVKIIGSGGLPVGIVDKPETQSVEIKLSSGDVIVMVTDGVLDAAPCAVGKEKWLANIIGKYSSLAPEALCNKILEEAKKAGLGIVADDMTVIAARVWKTRR